jgi:hypothetical protein
VALPSKNCTAVAARFLFVGSPRQLRFLGVGRVTAFFFDFSSLFFFFAPLPLRELSAAFCILRGLCAFCG